jgi:hypothetical protein
VIPVPNGSADSSSVGESSLTLLGTYQREIDILRILIEIAPPSNLAVKPATSSGRNCPSDQRQTDIRPWQVQG